MSYSLKCWLCRNTLLIIISHAFPIFASHRAQFRALFCFYMPSLNNVIRKGRLIFSTTQIHLCICQLNDAYLVIHCLLSCANCWLWLAGVWASARSWHTHRAGHICSHVYTWGCLESPINLLSMSKCWKTCF